MLKRILDISENSLKNLQTRFKLLKISKIPGENVEEAIGLLKSINTILSQCSTDTNDYVPQDFDEQLLKIFQTTSVEDFNSVFDFELKQARHKADKFGGKAVFPTKEQTFELATNTYQRLTGPGDDYKWCQPTKQGAAFTYRLQGNPDDEPPCYNCGTYGCTPSICQEPLDPDRIKRNREAARKKAAEKSRTRPRSGKSNSNQQRNPNNGGRGKKDEQGRPLKKNKNGVYIVDQKKHKAAAAAEQLDERIKELEVLAAAAPAPSPAPSDDSEAQEAAPVPANFVVKAKELRSLMAKALNR